MDHITTQNCASLLVPNFGHADLINGFLKIETCYIVCSIFKHAKSILTALWLEKCKACTDATSTSGHANICTCAELVANPAKCACHFKDNILFLHQYRTHSQICNSDSITDETSRTWRTLNSKPDSINTDIHPQFFESEEECFKNTKFIIEMKEREWTVSQRCFIQSHTKEAIICWSQWVNLEQKLFF